jgi:hypothetical protein
MDDKFYRNRARVLRELVNEADPLIKRRLLRLAENYDGLTTLRGQAEKEAKAKFQDDSRNSNLPADSLALTSLPF